jgi:endo-alpha-1,4-polygalactosaminidase (GH114 family)
MTELYPLLTVQNVQYWYWEHDPQMSGHNIAKEVGCYFQKIYEFMRNHNIPIRNHSEAGNVLFQDPKKYQAYLKAIMSPEYLKKQ